MKKLIRVFVPFATGVLFAVGLGVSGMTEPSKVIGFLDVLGAGTLVWLLLWSGR